MELVVPRDDTEALAAAEDAEVILGEPSVEAIRAARRLKWVQHWAAGVEGCSITTEDTEAWKLDVMKL